MALISHLAALKILLARSNSSAPNRIAAREKKKSTAPPLREGQRLQASAAEIIRHGPLKRKGRRCRPSTSPDDQRNLRRDIRSGTGGTMPESPLPHRQRPTRARTL